MKPLIVCGNSSFAAFIADHLGALECEAIAVRGEATSTGVFSFDHEIPVVDRVEDKGFDPYPEWDDINGIVKYEAAVSALQGKQYTTPHFMWDGIRQGVEMLSEFIGDHQPDSIITWNDRLWYNEVALGWARENGVPYAVMERGCFPGTVIVDSRGLDFGNNDFHTLWNEYRLTSDDVTRYLRTVGDDTLEAQPEDGPAAHEIAEMLPPHKPAVFIPLQVPIDTNVVFRCGGNEHLMDFAASNPGVAVVAKKHPLDYWTNETWLKNHCEYRGIFLVDADIKSIIPACCGVLTQNSQVAIDALRTKSKAGVIGEAFWKHCEATIDDPESVGAFVATADPSTPAVKRFLVAMRLYYLVPSHYAAERIKEVLAQ